MGLSSSPPSFQAHYITALSIRTHVNIFRIPPSSSSKRKRKRPSQQSSNIQQQHQRKSSPPSSPLLLPPPSFLSRCEAPRKPPSSKCRVSPPLSPFFSRRSGELASSPLSPLPHTDSAHVHAAFPPPVCKVKFAKRFPPMPGKLFHVKQLHSTTLKL